MIYADENLIYSFCAFFCVLCTYLLMNEDLLVNVKA